MAGIKVDVISGFLGAGKTTLLLKYAAFRIKQGEKIAVLENELGEVGIDNIFLKNEGLSVHEIVNGCICCSLKADFLSTLVNLATEGKIDRVLIEPTGIFMLNEIYEILKVPDIAPNFELGAVVTVIDGKNYLKQQKKYDWFFTNQIKWAHRLVISKTELVDRSILLDTIAELQKVTSTHDIEAGEWDDFTTVDWERIFSGNNSGIPDEHTDCDCSCCREHFHQDKHQHEGFMGVSLPCSRSFSEYSLAATVKMLSSGLFGDIPRAKGIVPDERSGSIEFDYVNGEVNTRYRKDAAESNYISFIGTGIQKGLLLKLFGTV